MDKVLVVDDDPAVRALLEIVGKRAGFTVDTAPDGHDALAMLRAERYSILVLDLMMPRVNGYEVLHQLHGDPNRPAIVVVTAMTGVHVAKLDPQIVQSIVRKPFDIEMMAAVLTDVASAIRKPSTPNAPAPPELTRPQPSAC
jgi:DNA-binding response OmpR family regulator